MRSGNEYIESLRERQPLVYYDGKAVDDVATHPAFKVPVNTLAKMYDLQLDPQYKDVLTFTDPEIKSVTNVTYLIPRSVEDLHRISSGLTVIYDNLYGFFGRCYDYLNIWTSVLAGHAGDLGDQDPRFGDNAIKYHAHCRDKNLFLTHGLAAPSVDRSKLPSELVDPFIQIGVVKSSSDGIVVKGACMVSTAAPYAEEIFYMPFAPPKDPDPKYGVSFACPTNLAGIKIIARKAFTPRNGLTEFEYPISSRFEESDAFVVFDNVTIPWENVLVYQNPEKVFSMGWKEINLAAWSGYHFLFQFYSRLKFLTGLAFLITTTTGTSNYINVQEKLGELLVYLNINRAGIAASEALAEKLPNGMIRPDMATSQAIGGLNMKALPRAYEIIKLLGASSLITLPSSHKDLENPEIRKYFDKFLPGSGVPAVERIKLFNMAWDTVCSESGSRYELYDRFSRGDPTISWAAMGNRLTVQREECVKMVKDLLDTIPNPE